MSVPTYYAVFYCFLIDSRILMAKWHSVVQLNYAHFESIAICFILLVSMLADAPDISMGNYNWFLIRSSSMLLCLKECKMGIYLYLICLGGIKAWYLVFWDLKKYNGFMCFDGSLDEILTSYWWIFIGFYVKWFSCFWNA